MTSEKQFHIRAEIPEPNLEEFSGLLEHLNKRAEKIGSPPIGLMVHGHEDRVVNRDTGETMRYFDVEVDGVVPIIEGWTLVAVIDHQYEDGNMIRRVPQPELSSEQEIEVGDEWRTAASDCDHCGYDRVRNETFLLAKDSEYKQVGRNCLKDFGANERMIRRLELMERLREAFEGAMELDLGYKPEGFYRIDIVTFLAHVAATIDEHGWLSKSKAREIGVTVVTPTAERAIHYIFEKRKPKHQRESDIETTEEHEQVATDALAWVRETLGNETDLNDYEWNLTVACGVDSIPLKDTGIVASLIPAYQRETGKWSLNNGDEDEQPTSEHVGEIGERSEWDLTVEKVIPVDTQFGRSNLYLMRDDEGNVFKWFTSSLPVKRQQMIDFIQPEKPKDVDIRSEFSMEVGWTYQIRGTIKDHEIYHGVKQTALSRCSVQEIITRPTEEMEPAS